MKKYLLILLLLLIYVLVQTVVSLASGYFILSVHEEEIFWFLFLFTFHFLFISLYLKIKTKQLTQLILFVTGNLLILFNKGDIVLSVLLFLYASIGITFMLNSNKEGFLQTLFLLVGILCINVVLNEKALDDFNDTIALKIYKNKLSKTVNNDEFIKECEFIITKAKSEDEQLWRKVIPPEEVPSTLKESLLDFRKSPILVVHSHADKEYVSFEFENYLFVYRAENSPKLTFSNSLIDEPFYFLHSNRLNKSWRDLKNQ